ncbi:uncharacterized protein AMSG_01224 [Thecamonas trahens ATCC 50062]|uniref:FHA domain-containing protein n=1 Tax=Thecamonas trahens ATCC 50062 TaxID=461836 RepID=A0A0L0DNB4_THETB|nr:hypothetical protein AMSG_01224 [Thecamonas trahens ATCC 50062]KNC53511.1 hypothetical protein AMSG_01224 [Thecamonas trahens ATCC 50062]|eukprot:XP_013761832.1 hypothetical protein AMSG_01224 [Thecamonas trahens ATCC 50062]
MQARTIAGSPGAQLAATPVVAARTRAGLASSSLLASLASSLAEAQAAYAAQLASLAEQYTAELELLRAREGQSVREGEVVDEDGWPEPVAVASVVALVDSLAAAHLDSARAAKAGLVGLHLPVLAEAAKAAGEVSPKAARIDVDSFSPGVFAAVVDAEEARLAAVRGLLTATLKQVTHMAPLRTRIVTGWAPAVRRASDAVDAFTPATELAAVLVSAASAFPTHIKATAAPETYFDLLFRWYYGRAFAHEKTERRQLRAKRRVLKQRAATGRVYGIVLQSPTGETFVVVDAAPDDSAARPYAPPRLTVGRSRSSTISLRADSAVSKNHVELEVAGGAAALRNVSGKNVVMVKDGVPDGASLEARPVRHIGPGETSHIELGGAEFVIGNQARFSIASLSQWMASVGSSASAESATSNIARTWRMRDVVDAAADAGAQVVLGSELTYGASKGDAGRPASGECTSSDAPSASSTSRAAIRKLSNRANEAMAQLAVQERELQTQLVTPDSPDILMLQNRATSRKISSGGSDVRLASGLANADILDALQLGPNTRGRRHERALRLRAQTDSIATSRRRNRRRRHELASTSNGTRGSGEKGRASDE